MAKTEKTPASRVAPAKSSSSGLPPWAPHAIVIGIMFIILAVYFAPLFQDMKLEQGDIQQGRGMSKEIVDWRTEHGEEPLWTNRMFGGMPAYQIQMYNYGNLIEMLEYGMKKNGLPFPVILLLTLFLGFYFLLVVMRLNPWLAGIIAMGYTFSSYWFIILEAGHNSKLNAMAYMAPILAGMIITYRGRYWLGGAITLLFSALELNANHPQITYYFLFIIFFMAIGQLIMDIQEKQVKRFLTASGILVAAALISVGPNLARLWSTYEYSKESNRGANELSDGKDPKDGLKLDYALQWSYGQAETFTLLVPSYMGGASNSDVGKKSRTVDYLSNHPKYGQYALQNGTPLSEEIAKIWPTYWGTQPFTSGPVYIGAILMFLFCMGLVLLDWRITWGLVAAALLTMLLSWGRNLPGLTQFFFDHLPMYNRFRAPAMMLVVAQFVIPLIAGLGLYKLFQNREKVSDKHFMVSLIAGLVVTAGLCLIFITSADSIVPKSLPMDENQIQRVAGYYRLQFEANEIISLKAALHDDRASMLSGDALRSFGLILAAAALLFVWFRGFFKITPAIYAGLALLMVVDLYPVNRRFLDERSFKTQDELDAMFEPSPTDDDIHKDPDPYYRVFKLGGDPFTEAKTSWHHNSVGGYHPAKLRRYNDVINRVLNPTDTTLANYGRGEMSLLLGGFQNISQQLQGAPFPPQAKQALQGAFTRTPVLNMLNTKYVILPNGDYLNNPYALGNAWFVSDYKIVTTPEAEVDSLINFDSRRTAIIGKDFEKSVNGFTYTADSTASIKLTSYKPYELIYDFKANSEKLVMFSDIYYSKGWNAYLDDQPVEYFRANYVLRAMRVPKGNHTITYRFEPKSYYTGNKVALVLSLLVFAGVGGGIYMDYKQRKAAKENAASEG
jgi:Bacterial membrane protein YfhO